MKNDKTNGARRNPLVLLKHSLAVLAFTVTFGLCSLLIAPGWVQGALPVFDAAAVGQMLQQGIQMARQLEALFDQVALLKQQIQSMTGHYGMGSLGRGTNPWGGTTWGDIADMVGQGVNPGDAEQVRIYKETLAKYSGDYPALAPELQAGMPRMNAVYRQSYRDAMAAMSLGESTFNQIDRTLSDVQTLKDRIDQTDNLKSAMDLNAAINVQLAQVSGEMLRMQAAQLRLQAATKNESTNGAAAQAEFFDH